MRASGVHPHVVCEARSLASTAWLFNPALPLTMCCVTVCMADGCWYVVALWCRTRGAGASAGADDGAEGGDAKARAVARAASAASALGGRDKDGLPLELDMDNYDNETGGDVMCAQAGVCGE